MKENAQYIKMTRTPVQGLIVKLSIPTIITMLITNIYNVADTAFVGTLGNSASGAVGIVFGFMSILQAIGFLFGQGGGSLASRKLGNREREEASRIASTAFYGALFFSIVTEIVCLCNLDSLVILLGSTETIAPYAQIYILCILFAAPCMVTSFTLNNILRYEGKAMLGLIGMMTGAVLNIAGDAILIFGFDLGIAGAGISTAVSQLVGFLVLLSMFACGRSECELSYKLVDIRGHFTEIVTVGFPSLLRQGLNSVTTVLLNSEAAVYGDAAVAAMSIVSRIVFFTFSIAIGIGQGFQPISSFNYGAGKYDRVISGYKYALIYSAGVLIVLSGILELYPEYFIRLCRDDEAVISIATRALRLQALAQLVLPFCMVSEMLFQSTGRKLAASILSACRSGIFFIPALIILAHYRHMAGIQEAQPLSCVLSVIPIAILVNSYMRKLRKMSTNDNASQ